MAAIEDPTKRKLNILGRPVGVPQAVKSNTATGYNPAQGTAAGYTAAQGTSTNYNATQAKAAGYAATTGKSSNYQATQADVTGDATVSGQLNKLLQQDNPYLKRASVAADQQSNSRGLYNSSMAVGAAQGALIDRAMPIAQQDASTYDLRQRTNMDADNSAKQFNAASDQDMTKTNLGFTNNASQFNAGNQQQVNLENMSAENRAREYGATNKQNMNLANTDSINNASQFTAQQRNAMTETNLNAQNRAQEFSIETAQRERMDKYQKSHELVMQRVDVNAKSALLKMEMEYKVDIERDSNAAKAYMQSMDSMSAALGNNTLSAEQQSRAVNEITAQLGNFLDFNRMLDNPNYKPSSTPYQTPAPTPTAATPAPAPAPAPISRPVFPRLGRGGGEGNAGGRR